MAIKVGMVSLGCAKNQVDGEMLMASLKNAGFELCDDAALADVAIVNTCGFIDSAKQESIDEILELATLKKEGRIKKIVVTGCLAERYREEIHKELPEVDGVFGIGANADIAACIESAMNDFTESFPEKSKMPLCGERELSTPSYFAYIKIAEGCDNKCTYCAIPMIRGGYRSRTMESIEEEARGLVEHGAKELILIAQDTTRYGIDLYGEYSLAKLMRRLCKIDGLKWLCVLYCYPDALTDELLETMAEEEKIVKYIDLPLQHASARVLKRMNRTGDRESLTALMKKIREKIPGVTLRTTLITGFPGETEEEFTELAEFVKDIEFERLGCFAYSAEENTVAAKMDGQIDQEVKDKRAELVMQIQTGIMAQKQAAKVGQTVRVLCDGIDEESGLYLCRTTGDAPEVDGCVCVSSEEPLYPGQFYDVLVEDSDLYDLYGTVVK